MKQLSTLPITLESQSIDYKNTTHERNTIQTNTTRYEFFTRGIQQTQSHPIKKTSNQRKPITRLFIIK